MVTLKWLFNYQFSQKKGEKNEEIDYNTQHHILNKSSL